MSLAQLPRVLTTHGGYRATRDAQGTLTVHRVPIFTECSRIVVAAKKDGEKEVKRVNFDADWIGAAVAKAKQAEAEGYLPPLHIRHHDDFKSDVRPAGMFRVIGTANVTFKGEPCLAVLADLIVTDPAAQADILAKRLPYRSVEIHNASKPEINSLALLDHEAPYLQLPMLMVGEVANASDSPATFDWNPTPSVAAAFRRGDRAALLFRAEDMFGDGVEDKGDKGEEKPKDADKGDADKIEADAPSASTGSVAAAVKAIESGEITVADYGALIAAMEKMKAEFAPDTGGVRPGGDEKAKADAPASAGSNMKDEKENKPQADEELRVKMAALEGRLAAGDLKLAALEAEKVRDKEVADALAKFEGRAVGANFRDKLVAFHSENGSKAFKSFVDEMHKHIAPEKRVDDGREAAESLPASAAVMKFSAGGPDAIAKATKHSAMWRQMREARALPSDFTEERYLELKMAEHTAARI